MNKRIHSGFVVALLLAGTSVMLSAQASAPASPAAGVVRQLGSIDKIMGADLSLGTDQGTVLAVKVNTDARILRLAPGQTDLKNAASTQLGDFQAGDRVLVRGQLADDRVTVEASVVIVMKQQDIAQRNQQKLIEWQRRGVGGLVKQVDSQGGNITLSVSNQTVIVSTTAQTIFRKYASDSVKWEDATSARLDSIHPGDQLRAKGDKNEDGTQFAAEEIVAGTFRNIAGLITSIDLAQGNLTVQDLATKKPVTVKITAASQMKILPAQVAQGLAMRMKGITAPASAASPGAPAETARQRGGDLNQLLSRLPAASLGDLQKGEAVMIVSTQGSSAQPPIAITLLGGVDPILTASPSGNGMESFLTPWSLASAPTGEQQ
jgi:hypothetical protein